MERRIPIDLTNPGQVFACMGFLEAAEILLGDAEGGFDWSDEAAVVFSLRAGSNESPFAVVLEFLASTEPRRWAHAGYADPPPKKSKRGDEADVIEEDENSAEPGQPDIERSETFPAAEGDRMSLPIHVGGGNRPMIEIGHWADGSSRNEFKLYAGNRSAYGIARAMLTGSRKKPTRKQTIGDLKAKGVRQLWEEDRERLTADPLNILTPMGGSFNFDPRGAWTAIDAGYSLNDQGHQVDASPVVEFLAAWGLENARPDQFATRQVRYAAWGIPLTPILARAALGGTLATVPLRHFRFALDLSGKNKVVTFAQMETRS